MTPTELLKAVKVAKLDVIEEERGWFAFKLGSVVFSWSMDDPALPAYVADLLVAKVVLASVGNYAIGAPEDTFNTSLREAQAIAKRGYATLAGPEQRIIAAMRALGHEEFGT